MHQSYNTYFNIHYSTKHVERLGIIKTLFRGRFIETRMIRAKVLQKSIVICFH